MTKSTLSVPEASDMLNVHPNTVFKLIEAGALPDALRLAADLADENAKLKAQLDAKPLQINNTALISMPSFILSFSQHQLSIKKSTEPLDERPIDCMISSPRKKRGAGLASR